MIEIKQAISTQQLMEIFEIRRIVFVIEQQVDPSEEYDEFEESSTQFIAKYNNVPAGTCRYRATENGFKLERFAILQDFRKKGIGAELLKKCLNELQNEDKKIYLHAQEHAVGFYDKHGFIKEGDLFFEANIPHYTMVFQKS